jgi:hypothetical protein
MPGLSVRTNNLVPPRWEGQPGYRLAELLPGPQQLELRADARRRLRAESFLALAAAQRAASAMQPGW